MMAPAASTEFGDGGTPHRILAAMSLARRAIVEVRLGPRHVGVRAARGAAAAAGFVGLVCACLTGCPTPRRAQGTGGEATGTAPVDAQADAGNGDGSDGPSRAELFEMFLEAAWTDLERPYPAGQPESERFYSRAGGVLLDTEPPMYGSVSTVAAVLAKSDDPRVERAMLDWAANPSARRHLNAILWGMSERPRAAYLEAVRAILANEALASDVAHPTRDGPFAGAVGIRVTRSAYAHALRVAMLLPGGEGRDLVKRIAVDRKASVPDPRVLAALKCPSGELQIDIEARGLASLRIMALDALDDRALMARIRDDPTEPHLVRYWMTRMLDTGPDRSHRDRKRLLDWRQRHAREQAVLEFTAVDTSPCFIMHPKADPPVLPPGLIDVPLGPLEALPPAPAAAP